MTDIIKRNCAYKFSGVDGNYSKSLFVIAIALLIGTSTLTLQQDVIGKSYESSGDRIDGTLDSRVSSPAESGRPESGLIAQNDTSENREITSTEIGTSGANGPRNAPIKDGNPSVISLAGDFSTQAALGGPVTFRSTNLASSTAIYEIQFIATTTGTIKKIDITFPSGTIVAFAGVIERVGIGPGALTKSGNTVTYTVTNAVSIPAGTLIRLELVDLINPPIQADYKISVTTKNPSNVPIDGPSLSPAYTIRQVSTGMIANGAVTNPKIADNAVTNPKIADNAVTTLKIAPNAVDNIALQSPSVSNSKIVDNTITSNKVAPGTFGLPAAQRPGTVVNLPPSAPVYTDSDAGCLDGEQVIGGGFDINAVDGRDFILTDSFIVGNSWRVTGLNLGADAMTLQSLAICALDFPL